MNAFLGILTLLVLIPLTLLILYQWLLAAMAILSWDHSNLEKRGPYSTHFMVFIPAHNEELCLRSTLHSLRKTRYPKHLVRIVVIADRCTDRTVSIAEEMEVECLERNIGQPGKGPAIAWALNEVKLRKWTFDCLVVLDADTVVAPDLFQAFSTNLAEGHHIQQAYCYISNPWQSMFTRVIAVTSILRNSFFYGGKNEVGLPAMLAGTGMCFHKGVIDRYGWTAFSVGEDWEFSAALILAGEKIHFNPAARVFQLESIGIRQASRQRLRWAGGRHAVVGESVLQLARKGLAQRSGYLLDAALTLLAPNYSSQASLSLMGILGAWVVHGDPLWGPLFPWSLLVFIGIGAYFLLGIISTESPLKALVGIIFIPIFLPWRLIIELLGLLGFGREHWFRTARIGPSR